jgi:mono/diheme cytochrome c family protein
MRIGPFIRAFLLVAIGGGSALTALANAQSGSNADPAIGGSLLEANCASCHAVGATGFSPVATAPAFRTLAQRYPVESLEEALAEGIMVGHEGIVKMPEFVFGAEDIGHIIAYLNTIQTN